MTGREPSSLPPFDAAWRWTPAEREGELDLHADRHRLAVQPARAEGPVPGRLQGGVVEPVNGIERCVSWICGLEHVRETIPYPRMLYRIYP